MNPTICAYHLVTTCVQGVILEEAQTRCGGPEQLVAAVKGKRVKELWQDDMQMFYFPNVQAGKKNIQDETEILNRNKAIEAGSWDDHVKKMTAPTYSDKLDFGNSFMKDMGRRAVNKHMLDMAFRNNADPCWFIKLKQFSSA